MKKQSLHFSPSLVKFLFCSRVMPSTIRRLVWKLDLSTPAAGVVEAVLHQEAGRPSQNISFLYFKCSWDACGYRGRDHSNWASRSLYCVIPHQVPVPCYSEQLVDTQLEYFFFFSQKNFAVATLVVKSSLSFINFLSLHLLLDLIFSTDIHPGICLQ